ncbi:MAG: hypothetical protein P4N59_31000 [Negativicutes bacterium]|nr:hypothetical protein [Negativicutes bacterium]
MSIDLFQTLPDLHDDKLHAKFKLLRDNLTLTAEKAVIIEWADGFIDRDNKIVKEFQTSFHSALWEIFLYAFMKEAGLQVDYSKNRPDFIITAPKRMFVEAVVSEIKNEGRKEDTRDFDDMLEATMPITKSPFFM